MPELSGGAVMPWHGGFQCAVRDRKGRVFKAPTGEAFILATDVPPGLWGSDVGAADSPVASENNAGAVTVSFAPSGG